MQVGCKVEYQGEEYTYEGLSTVYYAKYLLKNKFGDTLWVLEKNKDSIKPQSYPIINGSTVFNVKYPRTTYEVLFMYNNYLILKTDTSPVPLVVTKDNFRNIKDLTHGQ